jgi:hypothetical protein
MLCISFVVPDEVGWRDGAVELPAVAAGSAAEEGALPAKRARVAGSDKL